ncbi:MAG: YkgJ family cysteine cluster protein [Rubrivivax sp.]|nr:YkgJ family cysteine cluster protein [Rubrivivax sp.]
MPALSAVRSGPVQTASPASAPQPVVFFRDLKQAFDQRLAAARAAPGADVPAALLTLAYDSFDGTVALQSQDQPPLACGKGCDACCTLRVTASVPELLLIARFLRATRTAFARLGIDLIGRLREAHARTAGLSEAARVQLREPCPFLVQRACAIYRVRSLACRGHASLDAQACHQAHEGLVSEVPASQAHRLVRSLVQAGLLASLRDAQLPWRSLELQAGLVALLGLSDPPESPPAEADNQWLQGLDPTRALPRDEADEAEAREALDALLAAAA